MDARLRETFSLAQQLHRSRAGTSHIQVIRPHLVPPHADPILYLKKTGSAGEDQEATVIETMSCRFSTILPADTLPTKIDPLFTPDPGNGTSGVEGTCKARTTIAALHDDVVRSTLTWMSSFQ